MRILFLFLFISSSWAVESLVGSYVLDSGDRDCYERIDFYELSHDGETYGIAFDREIELTFPKRFVNQGPRPYQDIKRKGTYTISYNSVIDAFEYEVISNGGIIPFHYTLFLRKVGSFGLSLKIDSFHYHTFLGRKMECRYTSVF